MVKKTRTSRQKIVEISKDLFDYIEESDVLRMLPTGKFVHNKTVLTQEQKNAIIQGAKELLSSEVLTLLLREMRFLCMKKICLDSDPSDDAAIIFGKAGLWFEDVLRKKIKSISSLK